MRKEVKFPGNGRFGRLAWRGVVSKMEAGSQGVTFTQLLLIF